MYIKGVFLTEEEGEKIDSVVEDDGLVYWLLKGSNKLGLPLFPKSELSRVFKFRVSNDVRWDKPVKQLESIRFRTFADEMPFVGGELMASDLTEVL